MEILYGVAALVTVLVGICVLTDYGYRLWRWLWGGDDKDKPAH